MKQLVIIFLLCCLGNGSELHAQSSRERLSMDANWRFAFGHPYDTKQDFDNGTGYFSYFTKAGYGDGAAAANFDDRSWRILNLPHDWAVEQPFDPKGSLSHGFKAVGRNFPNASIGWYRKHFFVPAADLGRRISITFDGVYRNSIVWVNGHYLGTHASGYLGVTYDISAYLNYGADNVVAVRADATFEEGWFYEGTGIYRHVWLDKTNQLHVASNGTFVQSTINGNNAQLQVNTTIRNDAAATAAFTIEQQVMDAAGKMVGKATIPALSLSAVDNGSYSCAIELNHVKCWDLDHPYLYILQTTIISNGQPVDTYRTSFGVRSIRFDNNKGFFLNEKPVKIQGTNNHQDHAGVGAAMPDALQDFRIRTLKSFGCNAYRCSHNPPTPELLDACDRLGMLVIDENRLMGVTQTHFNDLQQMIERDRNHPCIISWSIGNEEWGIENNITGARIASQMQSWVKALDSTRPATAAFSGGIGSQGISTVMDLIGINYIANKSTDEQHRLFPKQFIWGTEEGSTHATRGAYVRDDKQHVIPAYDAPPNKSFLSIEQGWKHYASRDYLAGMFIWTGFDYRGEPTPYGWPSINSYFGMVDLCGFPKDNTWYLRSWWTKHTILHLLPHWNWKGKEGEAIDVWAYSNCDEVELFLNRKSMGKKAMERNGHLEWKVNYTPGKLEAVGYKGGKKVATDAVQTTAQPAAINVVADKATISSSVNDVAIFTISTKDAKGLLVPTANNDIAFSLSGPGKIIGVGNGNPTSLEPDQYHETIHRVPIDNLQEKKVAGLQTALPALFDHNDGSWKSAFADDRTADFAAATPALMYSGSFDLPVLTDADRVTFFYDSLGPQQSIYINGRALKLNFSMVNQEGYVLDHSWLLQGKNSIVVIATPFVKPYSWSPINTNPGLIQIYTPAKPYRRKLFNGLAQVIVQPTGEAGTIRLTATSDGIAQATAEVKVTAAAKAPAVD